MDGWQGRLSGLFSVYLCTMLGLVVFTSWPIYSVFIINLFYLHDDCYTESEGNLMPMTETSNPQTKLRGRTPGAKPKTR